MSDLRRRAVNQTGRETNDNGNDNDTKEIRNGDTPQDAIATPLEKNGHKEKDNSTETGPIARFRRYLASPRGKRRNSFVFLLGGLFGIFIALFFANHNEVISLDAIMDLNLDSLIDVMPSGILSDAKEFTVRSA